jgi:hypothetical protein
MGVFFVPLRGQKTYGVITNTLLAASTKTVEAGGAPLTDSQYSNFNNGPSPERGSMTKEKSAITQIPATRITKRKIGRTTFIIHSRFNEGKEKDIVSAVARLVEQEILKKSA